MTPAPKRRWKVCHVQNCSKRIVVLCRCDARRLGVGMDCNERRGDDGDGRRWTSFRSIIWLAMEDPARFSSPFKSLAADQRTSDTTAAAFA